VLYPAFVGVVVLGVMLFMMLYVVPQMVDFIREMGQELPLHTPTGGWIPNTKSTLPPGLRENSLKSEWARLLSDRTS
jgi:hypothetical protein